MNRAFGPIECVIAIALIALATWGIANNMLKREAPPVWLQPAAAVWT